MSTSTSLSTESSAGSAVSTDTIVSTSLTTSAAAPTTSAAAPTTSAVAPTTSAVPPATTSTYTAPLSTSIVSVAPSSTSYVPPASTPVPLTSIIAVTSTVTQNPATTGGTQGPTIVTITSTQPVVTITPSASAASTRSSSSSTSATQTALSASGNGSSTSSKGLSSGATIAIAVIIPIVAVVAAVLFGLWFWRRRKDRKNAQEARKNEMAEYGFNPNNDPTLPVGAAYTDGVSEGNDDSGYRGWGATTASNRKASTTLGSNSRAAATAGIGGAMSDGGSQLGGYGAQPSPSAGTGGSDGTSDPLMSVQHDGAIAAGAMGGAALGGAAAAGARNPRHSNISGGVHRGSSNASSAYSGAASSDASSDHIPAIPGPYYQEEVPYNVYNEPGHNPYGDSPYDASAQQGDQPVIRDVQARRNTRIERAPTFPQQGGIAQNF